MNRCPLFILLFCTQVIAAQQMSWITACAEQNFCLDQNTCAQGQVYLVEKAVTNCGNPNVNYSYKIDLNSDNVIDIQSSNDTVSGPIARGTHKITWRASDNCGNLLQCTYTFRVKDCQPPNLVCINGLTQGIDLPDCSQTFQASQFILSLSDNCTPTNQIKLGIRKTGTGTGFPSDTSLSFNNCEKGFNNIEVWAKDANGLANQCSNYVIIQDGNNDCICNNDADVFFNGCARTGANTKVSNFKLKTVFETLPGASVPLSTNYTQTIEDSCFTLHLDHIPFGNDYQATIRAERTSGALVGVTTFDLVLISKHILALDPFKSIYQTLAADVNKSNSVTTFDMVETRKLILGIYDTFPKVPAWRFIQPVADPTQVANFAAVKDTYQITLPNLSDDRTLQNLDFIGIKYGDVNGSANFGNEPAADDRYTAPPLLLQTADQRLESGQTITISFTLAEPAQLEGWQLALEADPEKLEILDAPGLPSDQYYLRGNQLGALWTDGLSAYYDAQKPVLSLTVRALKATRISEALSLNSAHLRPEVYSTRALSAPERQPVMLHFGKKGAGAATFSAPRPNPFTAETTFEILLEKAGALHLAVFDLNGRAVFFETFEVASGIQTLQLPAAALPGTGVFTYRISIGEDIAQGHLVKL